MDTKKAAQSGPENTVISNTVRKYSIPNSNPIQENYANDFAAAKPPANASCPAPAIQEPNGESSSEDEFRFTILTPVGERLTLAKRVHADGRIDGASRVKQFFAFEIMSQNPWDLSNWLSTHLFKGERKDVALLRDQLKDEAGRQQMLADGVVQTERRKRLFDEVPRRWMMLDIDELEAPEGIDPTSKEAVKYALSKLPPFIREATCVYIFSGSAGLSGHKIKLHLFFFLDLGMASTQLKAFFNWLNREYADELGVKRLVDVALFNAVQLHYIAPPLFDDPSMDPFQNRSVARLGVNSGKRETVPTEPMLRELPETTGIDHELTANAMPPSPHPGGRMLDLIGDDYGLHPMLLRGTAQEVHYAGPDLNVRELIWRCQWQVQEAISAGRLHRDADYVAQQIAADKLLRMIQDAQKKGFGMRAVWWAKKPTFQSVLKALENMKPGGIEIVNGRRHDRADFALTAAKCGLRLCPSRMDLEDMLATVAGAAHDVDAEALDLIMQKIRQLYRKQKEDAVRHRRIDWNDPRLLFARNLERILVRSADEVLQHLWPGDIALIKLPMATGKTGRIGGAVFRSVGRNGVVVAHRISLTRDLSVRLETMCYIDASRSGTDIRPGMATCVDSFCKDHVQSALAKTGVLMIDEFSQVRERMALDVDTHPERAYETVIRAIGSKPLTLLPDADINTEDVVWVLSCASFGSTVKVFLITPKAQPVSIAAQASAGCESRRIRGAEASPAGRSGG